MKIQCDVCGSAEASVFCSADGAALCEPCDRRVHRANKLAEKHPRFSLSSPHQNPLCDVCKEKQGFVFCQQDRAILCSDCDGPIHAATTLTKKHSRFLLTGVSLSSTPIPSSSTPPPAAESEAAICTSSSISDYLTKMLPGWHVEDFLTDESSAADGSSQANHLDLSFANAVVDFNRSRHRETMNHWQSSDDAYKVAKRSRSSVLYF